MIVHATKETFENEVMKSDLPVLVDFWATWCGPCQMQGRILEELAPEAEGKAKLVKVNVDEQPDLAQAYQVASIPTLLVFKNGEIADKAVGVRPADALKQMLGI